MHELGPVAQVRYGVQKEERAEDSISKGTMVGL